MATAPVFMPGESHGQGAPVETVHGVAKYHCRDNDKLCRSLSTSYMPGLFLSTLYIVTFDAHSHPMNRCIILSSAFYFILYKCIYLLTKGSSLHTQAFSVAENGSCSVEVLGLLTAVVSLVAEHRL